ncbi:MAG: ADP-ribosylglycohydrolase family protein, partial [Coriobacteriales bacterium]
MKERIARRATLRDAVYGLAVGDALGVPYEFRERGGFVRDTYDAALWCLANTEGYAQCVLAAVNLGHDADTTAAVAGALAGIDLVVPDGVGIPLDRSFAW